MPPASDETGQRISNNTFERDAPYRSTMKKEHVLGLVVICLVVLVVSFAGLISDFLTRLIGNIDGLLLLMICLMMRPLFAGMLYSMAQGRGMAPPHNAPPLSETGRREVVPRFQLPIFPLRRRSTPC